MLTFLVPGVLARLRLTVAGPASKVAVAMEWHEGSRVQFVLPDQPVAGYQRPSGIRCDDPAWARWWTDRGGAPAGNDTVLVTLTSDEARTVVVEGISVTKLEAQPLPPGVNVSCGVGGEVPIREIYVDLDDANPEPVYVDEKRERRDTFAFSLRRGEAERFLVTVAGDDAVYRWTASLDLLDGTRRRRVTIDRDGQPFTLLPRGAGPDLP